MRGACVVKDSAGQKLGYFYYDEEPGRRDGSRTVVKEKSPGNGRAANSVFERFPRFAAKLVIQI